MQLELDVGPVLTLSTQRDLSLDARVYVSFRAEDVSLDVEPTPDELRLPAVVVERRFLGSKLEYVVRVGQQELVLESPRAVTVDAGDNIDLYIPRERIRIWEKDGVSAIDANRSPSGSIQSQTHRSMARPMSQKQNLRAAISLRAGSVSSLRITRRIFLA